MLKRKKDLFETVGEIITWSFVTLGTVYFLVHIIVWASKGFRVIGE